MIHRPSSINFIFEILIQTHWSYRHRLCCCCCYIVHYHHFDCFLVEKFCALSFISISNQLGTTIFNFFFTFFGGGSKQKESNNTILFLMDLIFFNLALLLLLLECHCKVRWEKKTVETHNRYEKKIIIKEHWNDDNDDEEWKENKFKQNKRTDSDKLIRNCLSLLWLDTFHEHI